MLNFAEFWRHILELFANFFSQTAHHNQNLKHSYVRLWNSPVATGMGISWAYPIQSSNQAPKLKNETL